MKITVLADNHTYIDQYYLGEPAFSCFSEEEGTRFLFDAGYSNVFLQNADAMRIPVRETDAVILSHGHQDHTGGLAALSAVLGERRPVLVAHPEAFCSRLDEGLEVGCPVSREALDRQFTIQLSREPVWLTKRLVFLGEIPETVERREPVGTTECGNPDFCLDDTALAYVGHEGVSILTGCSHSGICNIAEYAKKVTGERRIAAILGGFHLMQDDARSQQTVSYLEAQRIPQLWPCHCTAFCVRAKLSRRMPVNEVGVGLTLNWE